MTSLSVKTRSPGRVIRPPGKGGALSESLATRLNKPASFPRTNAFRIASSTIGIGGHRQPRPAGAQPFEPTELRGRIEEIWIANESMSVTQSEKAARFRALHDAPGVFVIPNPWDIGSARILSGLGFQALATSSAASASARGRRDGGLTRDEALAHARLIVDATDLPTSADLGKGFGDAPEVVAETIRLAAAAGLVGCTIEDATGNQESPLYDVRLAVERIAAAAQAAHALPFPFILTARAHGFLYSAPSLDDTISRLQAFEQAGADVLFAPGLPDLAAVSAVCAAVSKPVNFMAGIKGKSFSVSELAAAGVRRISLATSLYRAAMTGLLDAASEVKDKGQFGFLERCVITAELNKLMRI